MLTHNKITKVVGEIAPKYGINSVYLFGSYARGDATSNSDCDLRIEGGNIRSLFDLSGLHLDLKEALGTEINIVLTKNIKPEFQSEIKGEEVLIYAEAR